MVRVLIGSRYGADVEALLNDAPSEVEVNFLPEGEKLADHLSGVEVLFGILSEADFDRADGLKWVQQPHAGAGRASVREIQEQRHRADECGRAVWTSDRGTCVCTAALVDAGHPHAVGIHEKQAVARGAVSGACRYDHGNHWIGRHRESDCGSGESV